MSDLIASDIGDVVSGAITNGYVTLADFKTYIKWTGGAGDDVLMENAITAASRLVDSHTGRRFYLDAAATERRFQATSGDRLYIDEIGTLTGLIIATDTTGDGTADTTWTASDYEVEPYDAIEQNLPVTALVAVGDHSFVSGSGRRRRTNHVTARWGWPTPPDEVKQATRILAARLYHRNKSPEGVQGFSEFGVVRVSVRMDPDAEQLLAGLRVVVIA